MSSAVLSDQIDCIGGVLRNYLGPLAEVIEERYENVPPEVDSWTCVDAALLRANWTSYVLPLHKLREGLGFEAGISTVRIREIANEMCAAFVQRYENPDIFPGVVSAVYFKAEPGPMRCPGKVMIHYYCSSPI